jgi:hypothetical protein
LLTDKAGKQAAKQDDEEREAEQHAMSRMMNRVTRPDLHRNERRFPTMVTG